MQKDHKSKIDPDTKPTCDQCKVVKTPSHYLLQCKQFEELQSKMIKNISYIFSTNGTTFKDTSVELIGEHTLNDDNSKKVREEIVHFTDKTKEEI